MRKPTSIKKKLIRLVLGTSLVVVLVTSVAFFSYEVYSYKETTKAHLQTMARMVAENSAAPIAFFRPDEAAEILATLVAEPDITVAAIYDEDGKLYARYPANISTQKLPASIQPDGYYYSKAYLEGFEPIIHNENRKGTLYLQFTTTGINQRFLLYLIIGIGVSVFSIIIGYLLTIRLQRTISEPIRALARTAEQVSDNKDYSIRATRFDNDEMGLFTDTFNHMLEQVENQNARIVQFNEELEESVAQRTAQLEQANTELKLKNDFVDTIIESSVDLIAVLDKDLRYVMMNNYARNLYQVEKEAVIGKNILELFPVLTKESPLYLNLLAAIKGKLVHDPYYVSPITGGIFENFFIPLMDKDHQVYSILVIGHDITALVKAHESLQSLNDELEKSNKDLEQFAYIASHDLQEPLRKIKTFAGMISRKMEDKDAVNHYLQKVIGSATRMSGLIDAVLNYSRLSGEKSRFEKVNLNHIITHILSDYELLIAEKNAEIHYQQLPIIMGDHLQLNQLFFNLISNALKFTQTRPRINISATIVAGKDLQQPGIEPYADYVKLELADNGVGFEQQYADKIFQVFQRLHSKEEYPGTGIGLALCKKIVDNHKGYISVSSHPGKGTTFTIYLPLHMSEYGILTAEA